MRPAYEALNRFFDAILVVSLRRATERQARLRERLDGLRYELHWGTDKADLDAAILERDGVYSEARAIRATRHRRGLRLAEIAASLSHRAAYERMLREGWRRMLVFEDDVLPNPAGLPATADVLAELPDDWELLYLGYERGEVPTARDRAKQVAYLGLAALRLIHWTPRQVLGLHPRPFSAHLRLAGKHQCAHAYAVSRSGAEKLVRLQTPVAFSADQLLLHASIGRELRAFLAEPKLFDQDSVVGRTPSYVAE